MRASVANQWPITSLQMVLHILSLMDLNNILSQQACMDSLMKFNIRQRMPQETTISQRPSTVALTILIKTLQQLEYQTQIELFASLLPILQSFNFDVKCKRSIDAGFMQSQARIPSCVSISSKISCFFKPWVGTFTKQVMINRTIS